MIKSETQKILVKYTPDYASGGRKSWAKVLTGIDDGSKGGYAFEGPFINEGEISLPRGTVIVNCYPAGSVKNWEKQVKFAVVEVKGEISYKSGSFDIYKELESAKIRAKELLNADKPTANPLEGFSTEELLAELKLRNA